MKTVRIVRVILLLALVVYLWLFHTANRQQVELPILSTVLPPLPVGYVVAFALFIGWLFGWAPARLLAWRRGREINKLNARLARYEPATPAAPAHQEPTFSPRSTYVSPEPEVPVIPDRGSPYHDHPPTDDEAG